MQELIQDGLRVFVVPVEILERDDLTTHEKMVYIVLRSYASPHEPKAFPSYATIAQKGSMSRRQAIRCVESLVEKGIIRKEMRMTVTKNREIKRTSNIYHIGRPLSKMVTESHQDGDCESPKVVTESHQDGDCESPDQYHGSDPNIKVMDLDLIDPEIKKTINEKKLENYVNDIMHVYVVMRKKEKFSTEMFIEVLKRVADKKGHVKSFRKYLIRALTNEMRMMRSSGQMEKRLPKAITNPKVMEVSDKEAQEKIQKAEELLKKLEKIGK